MINITFSKFVKMNGRLWEVNFRKLPRAINTFYADTATLQGDRIAFELQREEGSSWKLSGRQVPGWLLDFENSLGSAIEQGMQEFFPMGTERALQPSA